MCLDYYVPEGQNPGKNYYISPLVTPDYILDKFPPTEIFICERDPLRDEGLKFAVKCIENGVKTRVRFFKYLCHGLLNMAMK